MNPQALALSASGDRVVFTDSGVGATVRVLWLGAPSNVTTLAGGATSGYADGQGTSALFSNGIMGLALLANSSVVVADKGNCRLRMVSPSGAVSTIAGNGTCASTVNGVGVDGPALSAAVLGDVYGVAVAGSASDLIFFSEHNLGCIRTLAGGTVSTLAGLCACSGACPSTASTDGVGSLARFNQSRARQGCAQ